MSNFVSRLIIFAGHVVNSAGAHLTLILRPLVGPVIRLALRVSRTEVLPSHLENRIGHLICEPLYLQLLKTSGVRNWKRVLVLWDPKKVVNQLAYESLPDSFISVPNSALRRVLNLVVAAAYTKKYESPTGGVGSQEKAAELFRYTSDIHPNFEFLRIPDERARELRLREELGIPKDRWLCTLHVREPGPFEDEAMHSYRNSDPSTYLLAISEIASRGGFVVRIGMNQAVALAPRDHFLQLSVQQRRHGEADLILSRASRFFLGGGSGAMAMASSRGVPVAGVNGAPLGAVKIWGPRDVAIPKLYRNIRTQELASFREILASGIGDERSSDEILASGFSMVDNTPDEIRDLVVEMMNRLDRKHVSSDKAESLQDEFQRLFTPLNVTFFSQTRVGEAFLEKYRHLLIDAR